MMMLSSRQRIMIALTSRTRPQPQRRLQLQQQQQQLLHRLGGCCPRGAIQQMTMIRCCSSITSTNNTSIIRPQNNNNNDNNNNNINNRNNAIRSSSTIAATTTTTRTTKTTTRKKKNAGRRSRYSRDYSKTTAKGIRYRPPPPGGWDDFIGDDDDDDNRIKDDEDDDDINDDLPECVRNNPLMRDHWALDDMLTDDSSAASATTMDDLADFSPSLVSRISQERVQVHPDKIPTLSALAALPLPPPPPPHPAAGGSRSKIYSDHRKRAIGEYVAERVREEVSDGDVERIYRLPTWEDKQDAVDELFERVESNLKEKEAAILGLHPKFGRWVENALEEYLKGVQSSTENEKYYKSSSAVDDRREQAVDKREEGEKEEKKEKEEEKDSDDDEDEVEDSIREGEKEEEEESSDESSPGIAASFPTAEEDASASPVFMDCYDPADHDGDDDDDDGDDDKKAASKKQQQQQEQQQDQEGGGGDHQQQYPAGGGGRKTVVVPNILSPLSANVPNRGSHVGRMVEEWELSAHDKIKRIMLRQCTRKIARILVGLEEEAEAKEAAEKKSTSEKGGSAATSSASTSTSTRIFVCGPQGVGKSATLTAIVAAARKSGYLVMYLPEGDQYCQNGYYVEPDARRQGIFNLPILTQRYACEQFLERHENDLIELESQHPDVFMADKSVLETYCTARRISRIPTYQEGSAGVSLVDLVRLGAEKKSFAPVCYSMVMHVLMQKQDLKPVLLVVDDYNCYYNPHLGGRYYHAKYDKTVRRPIPYHRISLFSPFLKAMALPPVDVDSPEYDPPTEDTEDYYLGEPVLMKRGAVLVATTESHAVPRKITEALTANARLLGNIRVVEVPRMSPAEVEHCLANYEIAGVGELRNDQGSTVMNDQRVGYLKMVSGGVPQKLLDACIMF